MKHTLVIAFAGLLLAACSVADTFVETFDGPPEGHWVCNGLSRIEPGGGNPGAFFNGYGIDSIFPQVATTAGVGGVFTGNYRARQVNSLGADAKLIRVDFPNVGNRPMTLLLVSDNSTPGNPADDWAAYTRGENIPYLDQGWRGYDFSIPSDATTLPTGWSTLALGNSPPGIMDWNLLIQDVRGVEFWWGDPDLFYIFQTWEVGMDNIRISSIPEPASLVLSLLGVAFRRR